MPVGTIKKVVADKGYGFIKPAEGGGDIFFHHSSLNGIDIESLAAGQQVSFDVSPGADGKGPRATNIEVE